MEAHAGTIKISTPAKTKPRRRWIQLFRDLSEARRLRAIQTHEGRIHSVPGSEHTHIVLPPKAY
jgi:hypothetical protein